MINKDFLPKSKLVLPPGITIKNTPNKGYVLFDLPKTGRELVGEYTLLDHHVSVYEYPLTKLDEKSPYHYTARFCNAKNEEFRLHIYYNDKNQCIKKPFLVKVIKENELVPVACEEYDDAFYAFAHLHMNSLMTILRQEYEKVIATVQAEYAQLDQQSTALSIALPEKKIAYVAALNKQIAKLKELRDYSQPHCHTRLNGTIAMLGEFIKSAEAYSSENEEKTTKRAVLTEVSNIGNPAASAPKKATKGVDKVVSDTVMVDGRAVKKKTDINLQIEKLKKQFAALKTKKDAPVNEVSDLSTALIMLESDVEQGIYSADLSNRYELKTLREDIEGFGVSLLEKLLNAGQFEQANKLTPFYSLLSEKILFDAIVQNKYKLIDVLLKNKTFRFNATGFTHQGQHYSSLVDYYFRTTRALVGKGEMTGALSLAMAMSLSVLVNNNKQSIMEIDSHTGLPFAAVLWMKDPKHPLSLALDLNKAATVDNLLFCKQLKQVLSFVLSQANCSATNRQLIPQLISQLDVKIASQPSVSTQNVLKQLQLPTKNLKETVLGVALYDELYSDPAVALITNKADQRIASFKGNRPRNELALFFGDVSFIIRTLQCGQGANLDIDSDALSKIRKAIISRKKAIIDFVVLSEELFAAQRKVSTTEVHTRKLNKGQKKLKQDQDELIVKYTTLEKAVVDSNKHLSEVIHQELGITPIDPRLHSAPVAPFKDRKQSKMPYCMASTTQTLEMDSIIDFIAQAAGATPNSTLHNMSLKERKELLKSNLMAKMQKESAGKNNEYKSKEPEVISLSKYS